MIENESTVIDNYTEIDSWKSSYIEYIDQYVTNDENFRDSASFYLLNINGDDIPELHIQSGFGYGGSKLATYSDTGIEELFFGNSSGVSYIEGENVFDYSGGHMDNYYDAVYKIESGKFVLIGSGDYGAIDNSRVEIDENGEPVYVYYWNDKEVSKSEYKAELNKVFDENKAKSYYDIAIGYTYYEIVSAINDY